MPLMHVRVKRHHQTIFLIVEPSDSFARIRTKLSGIIGQPTSNIRLYGPDMERVLENEALISDHDIKDDACLYMVFGSTDAKAQGGWEPIELPNYDVGAETASEGGGGGGGGSEKK